MPKRVYSLHGPPQKITGVDPHGVSETEEFANGDISVPALDSLDEGRPFFEQSRQFALGEPGPFSCDLDGLNNCQLLPNGLLSHRLRLLLKFYMQMG